MCKTQKTVKLKLPKNPSNFIYGEHFSNYVYELERQRELDKLPRNLLLYYTVDTLINEVNNGGFAQYLTNSSVASYPFLREAANQIGNTELCELVQTLHYVVDGYICKKDGFSVEFNQQLREELTRLDDMFYALDEKLDIATLNLKAYRNNFVDEMLKIPVIKEHVSEICNYFVCDNSQVDIYRAVDALIKYVGEYNDVQWSIAIEKWTDFFRIEAHANAQIDLDEVVAHFGDKHYSFSSHHGTEVNSNRTNISFAQNVHIVSCISDLEQHCVEICPSSFDKDEYKLKRRLHVRVNPGSIVVPPEMRTYITLGYMNLTYDKYDFDELVKYVKGVASNYSHIAKVYVIEYTPAIVETVVYKRI